MSLDARSAFDQDGFVLFPGVLSPYEVDRLRRLAEEVFDQVPPEESKGDTRYVRCEPLERYSLLKHAILQWGVRQRLASIFGTDMVLLPSNSLCDRRYSGWHKDIHGQEKEGFVFQRAHDFRAATVIFYLQDNSEELGGGISVVPGSHLEADQHGYGEQDLGSGKVRLGESTYDKERTHRVPSRAGDLIVFDVRLNHAATWPSLLGPMDNLYLAEPPRDPRIPRKFLISLKAMARDRHVPAYVDYFRHMAGKESSMAFMKNAEAIPLDLQLA